ncbi:MAG: hypothetical protein GC151_13530 [Betaproteobacteria bacterium]|nr:hypothetical protein [Betaproteobacteria bacterium]
MSYHSAQVHFAVKRLLASRGAETVIPHVDCSTIDIDGAVAYQLSASGDARSSLSEALREALGNSGNAAPEGMVLTVQDAGRLLRMTAR